MYLGNACLPAIFAPKQIRPAIEWAKTLDDPQPIATLNETTFPVLDLFVRSVRPTRHPATHIRCVRADQRRLAARDLLFERGQHQRGNHGNAKGHRNRSEGMNRV